MVIQITSIFLKKRYKEIINYLGAIGILESVGHAYPSKEAVEGVGTLLGTTTSIYHAAIEITVLRKLSPITDRQVRKLSFTRLAETQRHTGVIQLRGQHGENGRDLVVYHYSRGSSLSAGFTQRILNELEIMKHLGRDNESSSDVKFLFNALIGLYNLMHDRSVELGYLVTGNTLWMTHNSLDSLVCSGWDVGEEWINDNRDGSATAPGMVASMVVQALQGQVYQATSLELREKRREQMMHKREPEGS